MPSRLEDIIRLANFDRPSSLPIYFDKLFSHRVMFFGSRLTYIMLFDTFNC